MEKELIFKVKDKTNKPNFIDIYEKHFAHLYRFIYYKTYHKETAEDIASHVFLKAFENIDKYDKDPSYRKNWGSRLASALEREK